jgi:NAD(P)H-dependent FMN reductase
MANSARLLAFAGSLREGSFNKKLVRIAADGAREAGADVTFVDLREFNLPIYNGDEEADQGLPEGAKRLKKMMSDCDGFLISSPEYNSSISGALKNAIDWASRPQDKDEPPLVAYKGKVAGIMAASPGGLGGLRGLVHLRAILGNIQVLVIPDQRAISQAHEAFDEQGNLTNERDQSAIKAIGRRVAELAGSIKA